MNQSVQVVSLLEKLYDVDLVAAVYNVMLSAKRLIKMVVCTTT